MFVKVTFGIHMGGDFLMEVGNPLYSGSIAIPYDSEAEDHDIAGELGKAIGYSIHGEPPEGYPHANQLHWQDLHVLEIEQLQTQYEANKNLLAVHYVWWMVNGSGPVGIVTTRNIFIVNDKGKTIDRVR